MVDPVTSQLTVAIIEGLLLRIEDFRIELSVYHSELKLVACNDLQLSKGTCRKHHASIWVRRP